MSTCSSPYKKWIHQNVQDLVVLDLSFQSEGLYSLHASTHGASQVYNVQKDISAWMRVFKVCSKNDSSIKCFYYKDIKKLELPGKVDVILTEHANFLFVSDFGTLLDIIFLRDRYLSPDKGFMIPSGFTLNLLAVSDASYREEHVNIWRDQRIFGFDLSPMAKKAIKEIAYRNVHHKYVISSSAEVMRVDLGSISLAELEGNAPIPWTLSFFHESIFDSLLLHFIVESKADEENQLFIQRICPRNPSQLGCPILLLEEPMPVIANDELQGTIEFQLSRDREESRVYLQFDTGHHGLLTAYQVV